MQFNHLSANAIGRFNLALVCGDKDRHATARLAQRCDKMRQLVFFARNFQPAFGGAFLALFRYNAHRMGFVAQRDLLHLIGGGHFEIQRDRQHLHQPVNVRIRDMAAVLAQMCRDTVSTRLLGDSGRPQGIRIPPAARIAHRCNVVNVHTKTQFMIH